MAGLTSLSRMAYPALTHAVVHSAAPLAPAAPDQYPLLDAKISDGADGPTIETPLDGTVYDLKTGEGAEAHDGPAQKQLGLPSASSLRLFGLPESGAHPPSTLHHDLCPGLPTTMGSPPLRFQTCHVYTVSLAPLHPHLPATATATASAPATAFSTAARPHARNLPA